MSFIENIKDCIGLENLPVAPTFRALLFGGVAVYVEGVKQMLSFTSEEIIVSVKDCSLKIEGEKLFVKKYCSGDLVVCGKILGLTRLEKK